MNPLYPQTTRMFSENRIIRNTFPSSSGFPTDIDYPPAYTDMYHPRNSPFIPRPSLNAPSMCGSQSSHLCLTDYSGQSRGGPWDADSLQEFLEFSENAPVQHTHAEDSGCVMAPEDQPKGTNWPEEHEISVEDAMDSDWSKILSNVDRMNPKPKVYFFFCHCSL